MAETVASEAGPQPEASPAGTIAERITKIVGGQPPAEPQTPAVPQEPQTPNKPATPVPPVEPPSTEPVITPEMAEEMPTLKNYVGKPLKDLPKIFDKVSRITERERQARLRAERELQVERELSQSRNYQQQQTTTQAPANDTLPDPVADPQGYAKAVREAAKRETESLIAPYRKDIEAQRAQQAAQRQMQEVQQAIVKGLPQGMNFDGVLSDFSSESEDLAIDPNYYQGRPTAFVSDVLAFAHGQHEAELQQQIAEAKKNAVKKIQEEAKGTKTQTGSQGVGTKVEEKETTSAQRIAAMYKKRGAAAIK